MTLTEIKEAEERNVEKKDDIQLVIPCRDPSKSFHATEEPFNFIPLLVDVFVVIPGHLSVRLGRNDWNDILFLNERSCLISFIRPIHCKMGCGNIFQFRNEMFAELPVVRIPRRQFHDQRRTSICGDQMNFGGVSSSTSADALWTVFFDAPVAS